MSRFVGVAVEIKVVSRSKPHDAFENKATTHWQSLKRSNSYYLVIPVPHGAKIALDEGEEIEWYQGKWYQVEQCWLSRVHDK